MSQIKIDVLSLSCNKDTVYRDSQIFCVMSKQDYEYLLSINKAPSLKELIQSQSYMHDHILQEPDKIRKFIKKFITSRPKLGAFAERDDLCEYTISDNFNVVSSPSRIDIYSVLTDKERFGMLLYDTREELSSDVKFNPGCCYVKQDIYIGLDLQEDSISLRQMLITWTGCREGETTKRCKSITHCTIDEFKDMDMMSILIRYPDLLITIDLYEKSDLLIKVLGL